MKKTSNFFKITLIYFVSLVLFVGVRILFGLGFLSGVESSLQDIFSSSIIQIGIMFLFPFLLFTLFFKKKPKETFSSLGFKKISGKAVVICFIIGLIAFFLNIAVSSFFNGIIGAFGYESGSGSGSTDYSILAFILNVVTVSILPAFCEEFLHRGVLMRGLFNSISVKHALIISSLCFGLMHLNIVQVFYATVLGLLIGFVSIVAKSIWPAIIIHFVNNFVNVYLNFADANGWLFGNFYDGLNSLISGNYIFALIIIIVILCALIFALLRLILELLKVTSFDSFKNVISKIKGSLNKEVVNYQTNSEVTETDYINDIEPILVNNIVPPKNTSELFMPDNYPKEKVSFKSKIFLIATIFLGVIITISTFIWGVL